ncbi:2-thiouracil desulfurase family protein [Halanaerobaculum tunisiense]
MILVSACLLGEDCKYDGGHNYHPQLQELLVDKDIISVCPERKSGLPTPRPPAEIQGGTGVDVLAGRAKVVTKAGKDVTTEFITGAKYTLELAQENDCQLAILKARSPSCGSNSIYDGSFTGQHQPGRGVTTALLVQEGIRVINEEEIDSNLEIKE